MSSTPKLPASLNNIGIRDTRAIAKAIKKRWPIPDRKRAALIKRQIAIATSDDVKPREATSAFRAVLAAEAQNIATETRPSRRPKPKSIVREQIIVVDGKLFMSADGKLLPASIEDARQNIIARVQRLIDARAPDAITPLP